MKLQIIVAALLGAVAGLTTGEEADDQLFDMKVSTVVDAAKTTLAFTVRNNGQTNFEMAYPGVGNSPIIIVTPGGRVIEHAVQKEWTRLPTQLKPAESKTWKWDDVAGLFHSLKLEELGIYKISWKITRWVSDEKRVDHVSNEILLLKESNPAESTNGGGAGK